MKLFLFTSTYQYTYGTIGIIAENLEEACNLGNKEREENTEHNEEIKHLYDYNMRDEFNGVRFVSKNDKSGEVWIPYKTYDLAGEYKKGVSFSQWECC